MELMIKVSKYSIFFIYYSLLILEVVVCEVYRVGDENGWNSGTGTNYLTWSQKYNFTAGDLLVFKYSTIQHNVKEVTDATYRSCDATRGGIIATYLTGNDEIRLVEPRKYNFICDKDDHCLGGMRFSINVFRGSNNNTFPTEPPASPPTQGAHNSAFLITRKKKLICTLGMLLLFIFLF